MIKFREAIFAALTLPMLAALWWLDPDPGAPATVIHLHRLGMVAVAVWLAHWLTKLAQPYVDREDLLYAARRAPEGAGLALVANAIQFAAVAWLVGLAWR